MAAISYNLHKLMRFLVKPNKIKENAMQIAQKMEINTIKSLFLLYYFMKTTTHYHSKNTNHNKQFM
jgi:hypothetical protein